MSRRTDAVWNWIAWRLPRKLVYFATIRAWAHGTTGKWGHVEAPAALASDVVKRWEDP